MAVTLTATLSGIGQVGGQTDKKTGEVKPVRHMIQLIDTNPNNGLATLYTFSVADPSDWADKVGEVVSVPVRPWVNGGQVAFAYAG